MASENKSRLLIIIFIFTFSLALDLVHIHSTSFMDHSVPTRLKMIPSSPFWQVDSEIFDKSAKGLLEGKKIDSGVPFRPPFYILILAGLFKITSGSYLAAKIFGSILLASSCVFIYLTGSILLGETAGIIAGILWASSFGRIMLSGSLNNEALYIFLTSSIIYLLIKRDLRLTYKDCLIVGLLSGMAVLTRSEFQLFYILILCLLFFRIKKIGEFFKKGGFMVLVTLLVLSPWMIRNYFSISDINEKYGFDLPLLVPVTSYGALNFALANNETADGGFSRNILDTSGPWDTAFSFNNEQHLHYFKNGYKEGMDFLLDDPVAGLKLFGKKLLIISDALSFGYLTFDFPAGLRGFRRYVDAFYPEDKLSFLINIILLGLGFALFIIDGQYKFRFMPVFALIFTILIAGILFFGYVRLGLITLPYLFIFTAYPVSLLFSSLRNILKPTGIQKIVIPLALFVLIIGSCIYMAVNSKTLKTEDLEGGKLTKISFEGSF